MQFLNIFERFYTVFEYFYTVFEYFRTFSNVFCSFLPYLSCLITTIWHIDPHFYSKNPHSHPKKTQKIPISPKFRIIPVLNLCGEKRLAFAADFGQTLNVYSARRLKWTVSAFSLPAAELTAQSSRDLLGDIDNIPDILSYIQNKTRLTRDTICRILIESGRIDDIFVNPQQFMDKTCGEINTVLNEMIVDGIKYEKIAGSYWEQTLFDDKELYGYLDELYGNLYPVKKKEKTVYDYIQFDSEIERKFAEECEKRDDIKFYFKLPFWFEIDTPIGKYNPDWALVYEGDRKIYFVAETKGTDNINDPSLSNEERYKIQCGKKHFANFPDVHFKAPVTKLSDVTA